MQISDFSQKSKSLNYREIKTKLSISIFRRSWGTLIVVSHPALNIGMLHCALGCEFMPQWQQTLYHTQGQHLNFFMILFGLFDLLLLYVCQICHVNCETENWKCEICFKKSLMAIFLTNYCLRSPQSWFAPNVTMTRDKKSRWCSRHFSHSQAVWPENIAKCL